MAAALTDVLGKLPLTKRRYRRDSNATYRLDGPRRDDLGLEVEGVLWRRTGLARGGRRRPVLARHCKETGVGRWGPQKAQVRVVGMKEGVGREGC